MHPKFIVGNWKMHTTAAEAAQLATAIVEGVGSESRVSVLLCPPFPYLAIVDRIVKGSRVALGAQNLYPAAEGEFTGEVSAGMLLDLGCSYVILGHSERRHKMGETDAFINQKVKFALDAGLDVILCVGETEGQREANQTAFILERQVTVGLADVPKDRVRHLSIAYEPVWAIGNAAHHATPEQAGESHATIRDSFRGIYGADMADALPIEYGGSVKPNNAEAMLKQDGVDGALIGGASLIAEQFLAIARAAITPTRSERDSN